MNTEQDAPCEKVAEIINLLDVNFNWSSEAEQQNLIVQLAQKVTEENCGILMAHTGKGTWLQAVKVIAMLGYPKNKRAIPYLMNLLLDVNWPGAPEALDVLAKVERRGLLPLIEQAIMDAYCDRDDLWLLGIQRLVDEANICKKEFANADLFDLLKFADGEW